MIFPVDFVLRRPFGWGIVIVGDAKSTPLPEMPTGAAWQVVSSGSVAVIAVHHASDVDSSGIADPDALIESFSVAVSVTFGAAPTSELAFDETIAIGSGVMSLGDADEEHLIELPAGRWRMQIAVQPPDHADAVHIWLSEPHTNTPTEP